MLAVRARPPARKGTKYVNQLVGERVGDVRTLRRLTLTDLSECMVHLGHSWVRQTVTQVEAGKRNVTVDEKLVSLAVALQTTVAFLLSPAPLWSGLPGEAEVKVDVGTPHSLHMDTLAGVYGFSWQVSPAPTTTYYEWDGPETETDPRHNKR